MSDPDPEEIRRIQSLLVFEQRLWRRGVRRVAGVDEAGRGPLAGPVVAAAVVFDCDPFIPQIDDSKKLSEETREALYDQIVEAALDRAVGVADVAEIDRVNIYQAAFLAMRRAVQGLRVPPSHLLIDGRTFPEESIPCTLLVHGDGRCFSIAAASIVAKVTRDRMMIEYDRSHPEYGFAHHKGYATPAHLDAIEKFGYCAIHRKSFHPRRFLNDPRFTDCDAKGQS